MKTMSFLILGVLVLSLAVGAAPARAAQATLGYMALVTQPNATMPLAAQAQMEFNGLVPALAAAKQSGYLEDFKPEFQAGIVILRFGSMSGATSLAAGMLDRPVYSSSDAALAVVPHQQLAPSEQVSAETISATFQVELYGVCFQGTAPANDHVIATLSDSAGHLKSTSEFNTDSFGYFVNCWDWSNYAVVIPTDKISFKIYDSSGGTLLGTFSTSAPSIKFSTLSKSTSHVTGKGPAGKAFRLTWRQPKLNSANDGFSASKSGTIGSTGTWATSFLSTPIRGGALLDIYVKQTTRFTFHRGMNAPYIYCKLGGNRCEMYGFGFQALTFKLTRGSTVYNFGGQASADGWLGLTLQTASGSPILVRAGDKVQGTNISSYTQPALMINAFNFTTDVISGKAPANKYFDFFVVTNSYSAYAWEHSNSSGVWSFDTTALFNLVSSETSSAEIYYTSPGTGNITDYIRNYAP